MRVFLCWSGTRSKGVAEALAEWLRKTIQAVDPWLSEDVEKGMRWNTEVAAKLEESRVGIVCLTSDNLDSAWIHFEAGALSKTSDTYVCTFLLDLTPTDIKQPLGQFQHTIANHDDVRRLLSTINRALGKAGERVLSEQVLDGVFETFWPQLQSQLDQVAASSLQAGYSPRTDREILTEILEMLRSQQRRQSAQRGFVRPVTLNVRPIWAQIPESLLDPNDRFEARLAQLLPASARQSARVYWETQSRGDILTLFVEPGTLNEDVRGKIQEFVGNGDIRLQIHELSMKEG